MGSEQDVAPPLLGRDTELADLEQTFRRVSSGRFHCVLVEGEAGVGKTRLANEFAARHAVGATILRARGHPLGATSALGLWSELFDGHLRGMSPTAVHTLSGGLVDDLAGLLRSAAIIHGSWREDVPTARLRAALATLLANLSRRGPVIAVLDDIHLADASSWEALGYLAHDLVDAPVLALATARGEEIVERSVGRHILFGLEQDNSVTRLRLPRLDRAGVASLATRVLGRPVVPPQLVEWLFAQSRGNPLFATTLLEALDAEDADLTAPALEATPRKLSDRVSVRLESLEPAAREVVELLAVIGHPVPLDELRLLDPRCHEARAVITGSGLVTESPETAGAALQITHPVIQGAIYDQADPARRRSLHRRIARVLVSEGRVGEAAPHFARIADRGEPEGINTVVQALAEAWTRGHFVEAFALLGCLTDLIPPGDGRWIEALDAMPHNTEWSSVYNRIPIERMSGLAALREIDQVLSAVGLQDADHARSALVNLYLGEVLAWCTGELDEAVRRAESARTSFRLAGDDELVRLAGNELAWIEALAGNFAAQEAATRSVLDDAESAGDEGTMVMALGSLGAVEYIQGRFPAAEQVLRRSIDLARATGSPARERYGLAVLAATFGLAGRLDEGRSLLREAESVPHTVTDPLVANAGVGLSFLAGDMSATAREGRRVASALAPLLGSWCMTLIAMADAEAQDLTSAHSLLSQSGALLADRRAWIMGGHYQWATGVVALADGDVEKALSVLDGAASSFRDIGALPYTGWILVDLAEAALIGERADIAEDAAQRAADLAHALDNDHYRGLSALAMSAAALARANHRAAADHAAAASSLLVGRGYRGLEARCQALLGLALAREDRSKAITCLQAAAEAFQRMGASRRRAQVLTHLDELGKPGRRAANGLRGPATLTDREREVAGHAVEGLTAREIGDRLYIGERTVETHLAHVYAKLGVHNRLELARAVGTGINPTTFRADQGSP